MIIKDKHIATVEALHDLLLDKHGYKLEHKTLSNSRILTGEMYNAVKIQMSEKEIKEEINRIKDFRKINKCSCVSTTHSWIFTEFIQLLPFLKKEFPYLDCKIGDAQSSVTIPINFH